MYIYIYIYIYNIYIYSIHLNPEYGSDKLHQINFQLFKQPRVVFKRIEKSRVVFKFCLIIYNDTNAMIQ